MIEGIVGDVELVGFAADEVIFSEGDAGNCLYFVLEGAVRISKMGRGGKQETFGFLPTGDFFGEMALIDGEPRAARATAGDGTTLGRIDAAAFARMLEGAPRDLHMNFLRVVVARLRSRVALHHRSHAHRAAEPRRHDGELDHPRS